MALKNNDELPASIRRQVNDFGFARGLTDHAMNDVEAIVSHAFAAGKRAGRKPLLGALKNHMCEVYSHMRPNFCWDIELYQAAGLLPKNYTFPEEEELTNTCYQLQQALKALLTVARPAGNAFSHGPEVLIHSTALADACTQAEKALVDTKDGNLKDLFAHARVLRAYALTGKADPDALERACEFFHPPEDAE